MPKFGKKQKADPAISTASLPDIVFMLLFFFMVTTQLREQDIMVEQKLPKALQLQKVENKSLVSNIYVGRPKKKQFGTEPLIQTNDVFVSAKRIPTFIQQERSKLKENERDQLSVSLKVDSESKMGLLNDVKLQLREADARKVNYSAVAKERRN